MKRRVFLKTCAAFAGVQVIHAADDRVVGQAYVWQQEARRRNIPLTAMIPECMAGMRKAGFRQLELTSDFFGPETREITTSAMRKEGLALVIVYSGGRMHEEAQVETSLARVLELADLVKPLGVKAINVNPDPKSKREAKTDMELKTQAAALNRLASELERKGLGFMVHHHDPEMADGAREWRHILRNTEPRVTFCIDTDWVLQGGQDPLTIVREAGKRLSSLHLRNSVNKVWLETLAEGDVDYRSIATYLQEARVRTWLVAELAYSPKTGVSRPLVENLRLSREFVERVFRVS